MNEFNNLSVFAGDVGSFEYHNGMMLKNDIDLLVFNFQDRDEHYGVQRIKTATFYTEHIIGFVVEWKDDNDAKT